MHLSLRWCSRALPSSSLHANCRFSSLTNTRSTSRRDSFPMMSKRRKLGRELPTDSITSKINKYWKQQKKLKRLNKCCQMWRNWSEGETICSGRNSREELPKKLRMPRKCNVSQKRTMKLHTVLVPKISHKTKSDSEKKQRSKRNRINCSKLKRRKLRRLTRPRSKVWIFAIVYICGFEGIGFKIFCSKLRMIISMTLWIRCTREGQARRQQSKLD